jgi:hypothetical protein
VELIPLLSLTGHIPAAALLQTFAPHTRLLSWHDRIAVAGVPGSVLPCAPARKRRGGCTEGNSAFPRNE